MWEFSFNAFFLRGEGKVPHCKPCRKKNLHNSETRLCNGCNEHRRIECFLKNVYGYGEEFQHCKKCRKKHSKISSVTSAEFRICTLCKKTKHIDKFHQTRNKTGTKIFNSACKNCNNQKVALNAKRIHSYISSKRADCGCFNCGLKDPYCLANDHIDQKQKTIGIAACKSIGKIEKEWPKTRVVCHNCHRFITQSQIELIKKPLDQLSNPSWGKTTRDNLDFVNQQKLKIGNCKYCQLKVTEKNCFVFDFDHIDPKEKWIEISRIIKKKLSEDEILNEINKCQLLCANCHQKKTLSEVSERVKIRTELDLLDKVSTNISQCDGFLLTTDTKVVQTIDKDIELEFEIQN